MNLKIFFLIIAFMLIGQNVFAQKQINKEIKAVIKIDKTSEFVTFSATSENLTTSDRSLRYEFMIFKTDDNNNTSKSLQSERFFLKGSDKKILSSVTLNNAIDEKYIILLLIYPINDDETQGAIGKDRIVVTSNEDGVSLDIELSEEGIKEIKNNEKLKDQDTSGKDGLFFEGLIIHKTLTKPGRDFYRYFYQDYLNRNIKSSQNIIVKEVPGQRRSTRISISVGDKLVWQFFARPEKKFLKEMAATSLQRCIAYLQVLNKSKESITRY